jgi:hypothetical protein
MRGELPKHRGTLLKHYIAGGATVAQVFACRLKGAVDDQVAELVCVANNGITHGVQRRPLATHTVKRTLAGGASAATYKQAMLIERTALNVMHSNGRWRGGA